MASFDDALRRAQSAHRHDSAAQAEANAQMTAIAQRIYRELESAGQSAFQALSAAGAEIVHAYTKSPDESLGRAALLLRTSTAFEPTSGGQGLWALERGGIAYSGSAFDGKKNWLTDKISAKRKLGLRILRMNGESVVRVIQKSPTYSSWGYPSGRHGIRLLIIEYDVETQQATVDHEPSPDHYEAFRGNGTIASPTDYIAQMTATRLAELH